MGFSREVTEGAGRKEGLGGVLGTGQWPGMAWA